MRLKKQRGAIIIIVLIILTLLVIITAAIVQISAGTLRTTARAETQEDAFRAAEAGAKLALVELRNNANWKKFSPPDVLMPGGEASFRVNVFSETGPTPSNGVVVPPGLLYVESVGRTPPTGPADRVTTVGYMIKANGGALDYAAAVTGEIELKNGSVVESRDPSTDAVLPAAATIVSNAVGDNTIKLDTNSRVSGMARPGPGAGPNAVSVLNGANATLGYAPLPSSVPLDPVSPPNPSDPSKKVEADGTSLTVGGVVDNINSPLQPGTYGDLVIKNGATLKMKGGTYVFDNILVDGSQMRILSNKPVDLYATGSVEFKNGSLVNEDKKPSNLKIQVTSGTVTLDLSGGGAAYYILNAPNSPVVLKNGSQQYGNLIGASLLIDGSSLFFDPSAGGAVSSSGTTHPIIKSYQRFDR